MPPDWKEGVKSKNCYDRSIPRAKLPGIRSFLRFRCGSSRSSLPISIGTFSHLKIFDICGSSCFFWFLHFFGDFMLGHRLSAATGCPRASDIPCGTPGANLPFFNKNQMLIRDSKNRRCLTFVFQTQLMGNAFGQIF